MKTMHSLLLRGTTFGLLATLTGCVFGTSEANVTGPAGFGRPAASSDVSTPSTGKTFVDPETGQVVDENGVPLPVQPTPEPVLHCDFGKKYVGFGGTQLEVGRIDLDIGLDVGRVKPFSAMGAEYNRVLGNTPSLLNGLDTTFGAAPNRWFAEPQVSAVSVFTSYRVAFQGCLTATGTGGEFGAAPTAASAADQCQKFANKFWSRPPNAADVSACVQVATVDTTKETDPRRRWAYTCASVLTAAGFLTF